MQTREKQLKEERLQRERDERAAEEAAILERAKVEEAKAQEREAAKRDRQRQIAEESKRDNVERLRVWIPCTQPSSTLHSHRHTRTPRRNRRTRSNFFRLASAVVRVGLVTMMFSFCPCFSLQRKQQDREAAFAADQALIAESRRIMDLKEQQRKDEIQRRADKIQV